MSCKNERLYKRVNTNLKEPATSFLDAKELSVYLYMSFFVSSVFHFATENFAAIGDVHI